MEREITSRFKKENKNIFAYTIHSIRNSSQQHPNVYQYIVV